MPRYRAAVLTLSLVLTPMSLAAQSNIQFAVSGFGGAYIAAADLFDELETNVALRFGHEVGFNAGGRVAIWPTSRLGIEAEGAYVGSDVALRGVIVGETEPVDLTLSGDVFLGSINVLYAFIRPPLEPLAIYVSGGVGFVSRGGDFYDFFLSSTTVELETTNVAGVAGIGIRYGVARSVNIRADFRDYISSYTANETQLPDVDSQLQNDILITGGVELTFGSN